MQKARSATLVELLVATITFGIFLGIAGPGIAPKKQRQMVEKCAGNLHGLANAMYIYAQDDPGVFPAISIVRAENDGAVVIFDPTNRLHEPSTTGIPSPTVDLWTLVRAEYATPEMFICPATKDTPDAALDPTVYYDFASANNLSYAYQYQHDPNRRIIGTSSEPTFPVMADANPYIKGGVTAGVLEDRLSKYQGNSANHGKKRPGENILFQDSHVSYEESPDVGLRGLADPTLAASNASRFRDDCYTVFAEGESVFVDPGTSAPTAINCNLGGKSDACLVP